MGIVSCSHEAVARLESEVNRRILLVAVGVAASTSLLLTGCSTGGGDGDTSDKIKTAGDNEASASPSASAKPGGTERPKIKLPKSFQVDFAGWTNSDPKLQTILNDGKDRLRAGYAAIIAGDPQDSALRFYSSGATLKSAPDWVKKYEDLTLKGSVRVFDPQVHVSNEGFGVLFYCVDEAKGYTRNVKAGKTEGTPEGDDPKVQYRTRLDKNAEGVWQTSTVQTDKGGCDQWTRIRRTGGCALALLTATAVMFPRRALAVGEGGEAFETART
ncbi:hypothetical protein [Streptomyces sp. Je 1-332]|uniref:hypothetical protein n=1 Tax=Streptomyces sp. Je 1-332 TaxID=3231270 RepID=UPI00345AC765